MGIAARFDLVKGKIDEALIAQTKPDDIIVVIEPKNAAERISYQFTQFVEMTFTAAAATLLVPSRISRHKGPVVAIASSAQDKSITTGLRLAEAVREKLLVLAPRAAGDELLARLPDTTVVHVERRSLPATEIGTALIESVLVGAGERLLVMSPGADNRLPSKLVSERGVPVFVTARGEPLSQSPD